MPHSKTTRRQNNSNSDAGNDLVFFHTITRAAKTQLRKQSNEVQEQVIRIFKGGKQSYACTPVQGQSKLDAKHARVNQSVRISFIPIGEENCVVHIGPHSEFEKFAHNYSGVQTSKNIFKIKNLPEMQAPKPKKQAAEKTAPPTTANTSSPPANSPANTDFTQLFKTLVMGVLDEHVSELMRLEKKMENVLSDVEANTGKVSAIEQTQVRLEDRTKVHTDELKSIGDANEQTQKHVDRLTNCQEQRKETLAKIDSAIAALERGLSQQDSGLVELKDELASRHQQLADTNAVFEKNTVENHRTLQVEANSLRQSLASAENQVAELLAQTTSQEAALVEASDRITTLELQAEAIQSERVAEIARLHASLDEMSTHLKELQGHRQAEQERREAAFSFRISSFFAGLFGGGAAGMQSGE